MLKALPGWKANNFREAISLTLKEAGHGDMLPEVVELFISVMEVENLNTEVEKSVSGIVHRIYGNQAKWNEQRWLVPVPELRFDSLPLAQITFTIQAHLVAALNVRANRDSRLITLVGTAGKTEKIILPLIFLKSLLDKDSVERFRIVGKDALRTGWLIPGYTETLWLPNDFVSKLSGVFLQKSVARWVLDFGAVGEEIVPLVVGTLLGLLFASGGGSVPVYNQAWDRETVIQEITRLYGSAVAQDKFQKKAHLLKAALTNHEAVTVILSEGD
jgi:hypothetical protein